MIRLRLLGRLSLEHEDGTAVASVLAQPKRLALLAYLAAVHPPTPRSRDTLVALLWPELDAEHARTGLRQALHGLRRCLDARVLTGKGDERVGVDPAHLWCDAAAFTVALERGAPADALALYGGPFLDGFHLPEVLEFERWVDRERRRLELAALAAAWRLVDEAEHDGDRSGARRWAERALELAPYDEECFRAYLGVLERQADRATVVLGFEAYARRLGEDLGLLPSGETAALVERIRSGPAPHARAAGAPAVETVVAAAPSRAETPALSLPDRAVGLATDDGAGRDPARAEGPTGHGHGTRERNRRILRFAGFALVFAPAALIAWRGFVAGRPPAASSAHARAAGNPAAARAALLTAESVGLLPLEAAHPGSGRAYFAPGVQDGGLHDPGAGSAAHDAYLRGRYYWDQFNEAWLGKSLPYFQEAIRLAPTYAAAYAGLAAYWGRASMLDRGSRTEACARGRAAAEQAVRLDPTLAEARSTLAAQKMVCDWDLAGAEADERRALELSPSFAEGHRVFAHLLVRRNRLAEAVQQARDGVELAPGSGVFLQTYAWTLYMSRMYGQAHQAYRAAVETDPMRPSVRIGLADTELQLHQYPEALADYRRAVTLANNSPASLAALGHALAMAGHRAAAIRVLAQLDDMARRGPVAAIYRARIYAGLGDTQQTLRWLERAYLEHDYWLPVLDSDPDYDFLHAVPAFQALRLRIAETVPIR